MPIDRTRQARSARPQWAETQRATLYQTHPLSRNTRQKAAILLLLIVFLALCVALLVLVRVFLSDRSTSGLPATGAQVVGQNTTAPSSQPSRQSGSTGGHLSIQPQQGTIGILITATGQGWWPGEPVFVSLRTPNEGNGPGYAYAAAVADDQGQFHTAFTFPNEVRWLGQPAADVIARGTRSGFEATTRFTIVVPTPTQTLPPPTPLPTQPPTAVPQPSDTALPSATPAPLVFTDWRGEYYANPALAGEPVFLRNDETINFFWGLSAPGENVPADGFSVRWSRQQHFDDGTYRFEVTLDDGARFWIDGQLHVDDWQDGPFRSHSFDLALPEGEHALLLEYYENLGDAGVQLGWERIEAPTATPSPPPLPTETPVPTSPPPVPEGWQAQYFANPSLDGDPVLLREDAELDFDWGAGSPGEGIPTDEFSARWSREVWLPGGTHRVFLEVDDGARVWLDGELLIDSWQIATGETYTAEIGLSEGVHSLKVEYFEEYLDARIHVWVE